MMHPIFEECCGNRYPKPFVIDGFLYATDSRIAVRTQVDQPNSEGKCHDMATIFKGDFDETPTQLPTFTITQEPCSECDGEGKQGIECEDCDGRGDVTCDMGHDHDCEQCEGSGIKMKLCVECDNQYDKRKECNVCNRTGWIQVKSDDQCEECNGKGTKPEAVFLSLDDTYGISTLYAAILRIYGTQIFLPTSRKGPLKFTGTEIEGRLMYLNPPGVEKWSS